MREGYKEDTQLETLHMVNRLIYIKLQEEIICLTT